MLDVFCCLGFLISLPFLGYCEEANRVFSNRASVKAILEVPKSLEKLCFRGHKIGLD